MTLVVNLCLHVQQLLELIQPDIPDITTSVLGDMVEHLLQLLISHFIFRHPDVRAHGSGELVKAHSATVVPVIVSKELLKINASYGIRGSLKFLTQPLQLPLEHHMHELFDGNCAVAIFVQVLHEHPNLALVQMQMQIFECQLELARIQLTGTVLVYFAERLPSLQLRG